MSSNTQSYPKNSINKLKEKENLNDLSHEVRNSVSIVILRSLCLQIELDYN